MVVAIEFTDATKLAADIRAGKVTARAALEHCFTQIDQHNGSINAIIWQDREGAIAEAEACDAETANGQSRGPLHGVPMTVKEAFDLVGSPSTWGNPAWKDNFPEHDSLVVQRYRAAGAVIFGKTNVPLALASWQSYNEIYGTTHNPWDLSKTPGGSSGGSAAALASGMSMLEAGSDIGSSIRNPAHYSGVFGHKPTWGVVPMQGHLPPDWHTDIDIAVTGPMARSARDLTLAFEIIAGADDANRNVWAINCPRDTRTQLSEFKVAVKLDDPACPVDQQYINTMTTFAKTLEAAGAEVHWNTEPELDSQAYFELYTKLLGAAQAFAYTQEMNEAELAHSEASATGVALDMQRLRVAARGMSHAEWQILDNERIKMRKHFDAFFGEYDILLTPVAASAAFPIQESPERYLRTIPVNNGVQPEFQQLFWAGYSCLIGLPTTVGRAGFVGHLPVGYQATTGTGKDYTSLAFAEAVEREVIGFSQAPSL